MNGWVNTIGLWKYYLQYMKKVAFPFCIYKILKILLFSRPQEVEVRLRDPNFVCLSSVHLSTFSTSGHLSVQSMLYSRYSDPNRAILTHIKIALHTYAITPLVRERTPLSASYQPIFLFLARTHTSRT